MPTKKKTKKPLTAKPSFAVLDTVTNTYDGDYVSLEQARDYILYRLDAVALGENDRYEIVEISRRFHIVTETKIVEITE